MKNNILLCALALWVLISLFHLGSNIFQLVAHESHDLFIPGEKKKESYYGEVLSFSDEIKTYVPRNEPILLLSKDGWPFFLLRYTLYPQEVYWEQERSIRPIPNTHVIVQYDMPYKICNGCPGVSTSGGHRIIFLPEK